MRGFLSFIKRFFLFPAYIIRMVRQRRGKHAFDSAADQKEARLKHPKYRGRNLPKQAGYSSFLMLALLVAAPVFLIAGYAGYNFYRTSRLYTPLDSVQVIDRGKADMRRFWGTYRSNLYFGMRLVLVKNHQKYSLKL